MKAIMGCNGYTLDFPVKHPHPEDDWGFIGFEGDYLPGQWFVGHSGSMEKDSSEFWSFQIGKWDMWNRAATWNTPSVKLIGNMLREDRRVNSLSPTEMEIFDCRNPYTFSVDEEGRVIPNIVTFREGEKAAIREKVSTLPEFTFLQEAMQSIFDRMVEMLRRASHAVLEDQLNYCVSISLFNIRSILLDSMVDKGILTVPAEPAISTVAMQLIVK